MRIRTIAALAAVTVLAGLLTACDDSGGTDDAGATDAPPSVAAPIDGTEVGTADLDVQPGVRIVAVSGAEPGAELALIDGDGDGVGRGSIDRSDASVGYGVADDEGNLTFRVVPPGDGYEVRLAVGEDEYEATEPFDVLAIDDAPGQAFFDDQDLVDGYQYIETRDGTLLAANVMLPGPAEDGPYPTVVEYSGYSPANPEGAEAISTMWNALGYAVVGVNMRGTGCSGGSFDLFDPAQTADGYDVIEAVAAQDWVLDHEVGMVGVSYSGITQLYTAATQPPSLAAITPLSVTTDIYRGTGYPGGIFNNGFAQRWLTERVDQAQSVLLPEGEGSNDVGQGWARDRVADGDEICAENQTLRSTNIDSFEIVQENQYIIPEWVDDRILHDMVDRVEVPTFLAGAWQDEQTGGFFPNALDRFSDDLPMYITLTNGAHTDALAPQTLPRLYEFIELYVAKRVPQPPAIFDIVADILGAEIFGGDVGEIPEVRFTDAGSYDEALADYEADPRVRILFESGAAEGNEVGAPQPTFEATVSAWPIPEVEATTFYFGPDGTLTTDRPSEEGADVYTPDPDARPPTNLPGTSDSDAWVLLPGYTWEPLVEGAAVAYLSEPLEETTVMAGSGSVDAYVRANVPDADLQVTLTEVREDGEEVFVQTGWLRASQRALDEARSTELLPYHTHLEADAADLPEGELELVRVPIWPFAHVFQEGSQIRVSIQAPGGDRQRWRFDTFPYDADTEIEVAFGGDADSLVVLPVLPDVTATGAVPPCPSLRGQPCRTYVPWSNQPAG